MAQPVNMLCIYRVTKGKEDEFKKLLARHWPTLHKAGLTTDKPATVHSASSHDDKTTAFVEMFQWKDGGSSDIAHQTPEVMAVWEPMGSLTEGMEFLEIEPVKF